MNAAHHARWPLTSGPSRSAWATSPPLGCWWPALTIGVIVTQPESWYSFYRPTGGGRLSRPRWLARHPDGVPARKMVTHPVNSCLYINKQKKQISEWQRRPINSRAFWCIIYCSAQLYSTPSTLNLQLYHWLNGDSWFQKNVNLSSSSASESAWETDDAVSPTKQIW